MKRLKIGDRIKVDGFLHWLNSDQWTLQTEPIEATVLELSIGGALVRIRPDLSQAEIGVYFKQCRKILRKEDGH